MRAASRQASSLGASFDWKRNGLNAVRLFLASGVIVWHSFPLTGRDIGFAPLRQLLAEVWVDGFFAASGFLIVASWLKHPDWSAFLTARVLRIMPAFWVCLLVTGFVLVPVILLLGGVSLPAGYWPSAVTYVLSNLFLQLRQYDVAGTPAGVPYPGVWDGSLWTLWWEFLCYLGVLALGVTRLLKRRWTIELVFVLAVAGSVLASLGLLHNYYYVNGARFAVMFAAGALIHKHRARIPVSWPIMCAAGVVILGSTWLPDYRMIAALPLAYLVIAAGALLRAPAYRLRNDISYGVYIYAFPVQQALAVFGLYTLHPLVFALLAIVPTVGLAAASWWLVEKRVLRLRGPLTSWITRVLKRRSAKTPAVDGISSGE